MTVDRSMPGHIDGDLLHRLQHGWPVDLDTDALWCPPELQVKRNLKFVRKGLDETSRRWTQTRQLELFWQSSGAKKGLCPWSR